MCFVVLSCNVPFFDRSFVIVRLSSLQGVYMEGDMQSSIVARAGPQRDTCQEAGQHSRWARAAR